MDVVQTLNAERDRVQKELNGLNVAIKALGGNGHGDYTPDTQHSREGTNRRCSAGAMGKSARPEAERRQRSKA